ncbi:putative holin-like toxin [Brevibacillus centrosporus]|uniref:putative holin-like toxin n=1 Tax=Brevibacillus centrosporus TaxID=54910 RepID=UPI0027D996BD|nr:putative holin-like toxin [Brevibacillus centrosporus]
MFIVKYEIRTKIRLSKVIGSLSHGLQQGGDLMEVYQALTLMLMFGSFVIALLTCDKKK